MRLLCAIAFALAGPALASDVRLGQVSLSFYAVTGEVVRAVLEENGHEVTTIEGSHAEIYPQLGSGEVDLLAASWLPNGHADLFAEVEDSVERLTPFYEDARFFWVVPASVPENSLSRIEDLTDPDVAAQMAKTIQTLGPDTGLTIGAERMMEVYGLPDAGYRLEPGEAAVWSEAIQTASETGTWFVAPLWQPHWLNAVADLRRLEDDENVYGADDTAWLLANRSLRDRLDASTLEHLAAIRLSVDDVTEMDRWVNIDGLTPKEAAARWMANNPEKVASWRPDP